MKQRIPNLVSVIIPTFNRADHLERALSSCLKQSHREIEILVIDNGSSDGTPEMIDKLRRLEPDRLRLFSPDRRDPCTARNLGLEEARGEFIQLLDDDDILLPDKFRAQVAALRESPHPVAVSDFQYTTGAPLFEPVRAVTNAGDLKLKLSRLESIFYGAALIRSASIPDGLRYDASLPCYQDIDFMFRYFLGISGWVYTPGVHILYVNHDSPRISDRYGTTFPYNLLFRSARNYWRRNRHTLDGTSGLMVSEYALSISRRYLYEGMPQQALRHSLASLTLPANSAGRYKALKTAIRSVVLSLVPAAGRRSRAGH